VHLISSYVICFVSTCRILDFRCFFNCFEKFYVSSRHFGVEPKKYLNIVLVYITKEEFIVMIHTQCGCVVHISNDGDGTCSGCGKKIKVRVSHK